MAFLNALTDKLITRHKVCAGLRRLGLDAIVVTRGRPEENIGEEGWVLGKDEKSLGLIEVRDSPIRWVNVLDIVQGKGTQGESVVHRNVYLIPDSMVSSKGGYMLAKSVRVRSTPLIGRVVDIRWEGGKSHGNLMRRMSDDILINRSLVRLKEDITIRGFPEYSCWAILSSRSSVGGFPWGFFGRPAPSREQWSCYETIAHHLLESDRK